jgi:hypothetical protein
MAEKLQIDILARDKSKQALSGVQKRLGNVKNAVFSLRGALVGLGAGAVIRGFVNVGKEVESLQVRFKFLFGSVEEGSKAFDNLAKFAGTVPFSLEEISRASGNLAVVAKDADDLNRVLEITGNVAAVTGLDFETTSSQIQRAFAGGIGAADLFRERGVRALLGFEAGAKVTAEETVKRFEELFSGNGRFAGATNDLATTLEGTLSMLGDKFFNFQKDVAEGFFDELKGEFGDLNKFLEDNEQAIEDIANSIGTFFAGSITKTSQAIKDLTPALITVKEVSGDIISGFNSLPSEVKTAGIISVLLFGKKGIAIAGALSLIVSKIQDIADISKDLQVIDPSNLTNIDFLNEKLGDLNKEIKELEKPVETSITVAGGKIELPLEELDAYNIQEQRLQKLYADRATVLRILNNLSFEQSDFYTNLVPLVDDSADAINNENEVLKEQVDLLDELKRRRVTELQLSLKALREKQDQEKKYYEELERRQQTDRRNSSLVIMQKVELEKQGQAQIFDAVKDTASKLSGLNKNAFRAYQAFQIAMATVNTFRAVSNALATFPPPLNAFVAGAELARGLATVASIRNTAPPRIAGGRVNAGQPYMVGEGGKPEMFVPQQSGTIVPNNQLTGTNVNITIMANDTEGFDELLSRRRATVVNIINDALNSQGKEAII